MFKFKIHMHNRLTCLIYKASLPKNVIDVGDLFIDEIIIPKLRPEHCEQDVRRRKSLL